MSSISAGKIIQGILKNYGPLTGKELKQYAAEARYVPEAGIGDDVNAGVGVGTCTGAGDDIAFVAGTGELSLWRLCMKVDGIFTSRVGKRYLRLDKNVEGYARLSPSIIREFHGYTVIGTKDQLPEIRHKASLITEEMLRISRRKFSIAEETIRKIVEIHDESELIKACTCFIIAGDVAYGMSHAEPRPESSTGWMVNGSDLDIIAVTENLPENISKSLEQSIYERKYYLLKNPSYREELDFVVKDISKAEEQMQFDTFRHMVASKIMDEGLFLYGSNRIFDKLKKMLETNCIPQKLADLEKAATAGRAEAETYLQNCSDSLPAAEYMKLFCTNEEREEFE